MAAEKSKNRSLERELQTARQQADAQIQDLMRQLAAVKEELQRTTAELSSRAAEAHRQLTVTCIETDAAKNSAQALGLELSETRQRMDVLVLLPVKLLHPRFPSAPVIS